MESGDPDAADAAAVETAAMMPEEGDGMVDLGSATEHEMSQASGLQITGLRGTVSGSSGAAGHFTGLFSSSDSSEDDDDDRNGSSDDEGDAGRDHTVGREEGDFEQGEKSRRKGRRPSTTEAKERGAIDDDYDDDDDGDEVNDGREVFGLPKGEDKLGRGQAQEEQESSGSGSSDDEGMVEIRTRRSS